MSARRVLLARLVSPADPGLPRFVFRPGRFPGRRKRRLRLADGRRQLPRLLLLGRFAKPLFPARPGLEFRVELLRPGREVPDRAFQALQQFECLADSQVATHSPA